MQIFLHLKNHCIETTAKKEYERLIKQYFKKSVSGDEKIVIEEQIEILKDFLEDTDFLYLRNTYPELSGESDFQVNLQKSKDNKEFLIDMNRNIVQSKMKEDKWKK